MLLAVVVALVVESLPRRVPSFRMPDGSILRLEYVTYQRTPRLVWLKKAKDWMTAKLGRPVLSHPFAAPGSLVFWISRKEKETGKYLAFGSVSRVAAVDSHGCEFDAEGFMMVHAGAWMSGGRGLPNAPPGSKYILTSAVLPVVPKRERTFELRLFDDTRELLGRFEVQNPLYRRYPTWQPDALPVKRSKGDLTVELAGCSNRWVSSDVDNLPIKFFSLAPVFRIPPGWELSHFDIEDATGNRGAASVYEVMERRMRLLQGWLPTPPPKLFQLCTGESAWQLRAAFFRTAEGPFATNEIWSIPNFQIPRPGVARVLTGSRTWQRATVRLCAVSGAGSFAYSNGVPVNASAGMASGGSSSGRIVGGKMVSDINEVAPNPQIMLQVSRPDEEYRLEAISRVNGRNYRSRPASSSNDYQLHELQIPAGTESVDLMLVIQEPRWIEFMVRPELPKEKDQLRP